jgi:hypothetical protein
MSDEPTYTEDQLVEMVATAFAPNTLEAEDAMWGFVDAETRHAPFETKVQRFAEIIAQTSARRNLAQQWVEAHR